MTHNDRPRSPDSPIVIVGGGLAGLFCALRLAPIPVTVLTAAPIGQGASSAWAQAGIAAAMAPGDSVESHLADTLAAGAGHRSMESLARIMVSDAADRVHDLLDYGVPFDRDLEGKLTMSREAAHSERRIVHVRGDMAGTAIMSALVDAVRRTSSIKIVEDVIVESIVVNAQSAFGLRARPRLGASAEFIAADAVVLAVGGVGHLYKTTNQSGPRPKDPASVWLPGRARSSLIRSLCSFTPPRCRSVAIPLRCSPKRCAARGLS